jgi:hypothetical protein
MKYWICVLLCCLSGLPQVRAQEGDMPPATLLTRFEYLQLNGGIVVLKARLDQFSDTLNFILDTGSGGISLDTLTAAYYKLPLEPSDRTVRGIGGVRQLSFYKKGTLHFPGLEVNNLDFHINDYQILTEVYGIRVDGIIGYSFLRRFIVAIDYDKHQISVYTPGKFNYPREGIFLHPEFATIPVTEHEITDARSLISRLYFDTGAGLCIMLSEQYMKDSSLLVPHKKVVSTQVEGIAGKITMRLSTIKRVKIGPYRFRKVPVHIYKDSVNVFNYPEQAGLIGNDLLRRFNKVINYPDRTIHLTPNSHMREDFDYSYTGMNYYYIDGRVVITEVQQGSPAEKAGFQPGDVIFGINSNFSNNIQQYKALLQNAGERLRIIVFRNNQPMMVDLRVGSILR